MFRSALFVFNVIVPIFLGAILGVVSLGVASELPDGPCLNPFMPRAGADRERSLELERVVRASRDVFWSKNLAPALKLDELPVSSPAVFLDSNIAFHLIGYLNSTSQSNEVLVPALKEGFTQLERWLEKLETADLSVSISKGSNLKVSNSKEEAIVKRTKFVVTPQVMRELKKHNMLKYTNGNVTRIGFDSKNYAQNYDQNYVKTEFYLHPNQTVESAATYHEIYESLIERFYKQGLGVKSGHPKSQRDGIKDRRILSQLLFATHLSSPPGSPLRFVTRDIGIYLALFRLGILTGTLRGRDEPSATSLPSIDKLDSELQSELLFSLDKGLVQLLFQGAFDLTLHLQEASGGTGEGTSGVTKSLGERNLQILAVPGVARDQIQSTLKLNSRAFRQFKERDANGFYNWILAILKRADEQKLKIKVLIEDPTQLTKNNRPQILNQELTYSIYKEKFNPESASKIMLLELTP